MKWICTKDGKIISRSSKYAAKIELLLLDDGNIVESVGRLEKDGTIAHLWCSEKARDTYLVRAKKNAIQIANLRERDRQAKKRAKESAEHAREVQHLKETPPWQRFYKPVDVYPMYRNLESSQFRFKVAAIKEELIEELYKVHLAEYEDCIIKGVNDTYDYKSVFKHPDYGLRIQWKPTHALKGK